MNTPDLIASSPTPLTDDRAVTSKEGFLLGKSIALAIGGGIAATESVKLIRALRRYGATVQVYVGHEALKFITPIALEWASTRPPVSEARGSAEHLFTADLLIVAPATFNIVSKTALGISDSLITTLVASALGKIALERSRYSPHPQTASHTEALTQPQPDILPHSPPPPQPQSDTQVLMVASMHLSLAKNPFMASHQATLKRCGVTWLPPRYDEGKAKTPSAEAITLAAIRSLAGRSTSRVRGKKIFITAGAVPTYIDNVRMISNIATGTTGCALATYAHALGADVTLLLEQGRTPSATSSDLVTLTPAPYTVVTFKDYDDYREKTLALVSHLDPDQAIFAAAVSDYRVKNFTAGKIASHSLTHLALTTTDKVIRKVHEAYPTLNIIAFKLEAALSVQELLHKSETRFKQEDYTMMIVNRLEDLGRHSLPPQSEDPATVLPVLDPSPSSLAPPLETGMPPPHNAPIRYVLERTDKGIKHTAVSGHFGLAKHLFA